MEKSRTVQAQIAYGKPQELSNIITHALGAALSLVGLIFLMLKTVNSGRGGLAVAAVLIYGVMLTVTLVLSALYHMMPLGSRSRAFLFRLDHCPIALLTLGAFSPVMLIGLASGTFTDAVWGYTLFAIVAAAAVLSVALNAANATKFKTFSLIVYVVMGWACVMGMHRIAALCGLGCFWFLLGGGIVYALGVIFYACKKIPFNHAIWHLFVLGGAVLQFVGIYTFLL